MSSTLWTTCSDSQLLHDIADGNGAEIAQALKNVREGMSGHKYDKDVVDFVQQHATWRLPDMWIFAHIWTSLGLGEYASFTIPVGSFPSGDAMLEDNRRKLANLPPGFAVDLRCTNNEDGDGSLSWDFPLVAHRRSGDRKGPVSIGPFSTLLEVGAQPAGRTWHELNTYGCLARWSYGSDKIVVVIDLEHFAVADAIIRRVEKSVSAPPP